jgi:pyrophosphatase PpaX
MKMTQRNDIPTHKYTSFLFDMDGTLVDTKELIYQCFVYTVKEFHGQDVGRELVISHIGLPLKAQLEMFLGEMTDIEFEEVYRLYNNYQLEIIPDYLIVFPYVYTTLDALKQRGKKLAVVTSRKRKSLDVFLKVKRLASYFDVLITPESTERHKPHPDPVFKALAMLNTDTKHALFIGDSVYDVESGKAAGVDTALLTWSQNNVSHFYPQPTYRLKSLRDLVSDC